MLDEIPYEPNKPLPKLPRKTLALGGLGLTVAAALTALSAYFLSSIWTGFAKPYLDSGPIVEVNFGALSALGAFPAMAAFLALMSIFWIGYLRGWQRGRIERLQRRTYSVAVAGLVGIVITWIGVGPLLSWRVADAGYLHCSRLSSDLGINYYRRVYVQHPFLCVERDTLESRVALYNQLLQARREGRLSDALAAASLTVTQNGYIVPVEEEGRN